MRVLKLIAVGDIALETKSDVSLFGRVKEAFSDKDILFGNLETVLSTRGEKIEKAKLLYTCPERVKYLEDAGFDILNLANNHIMDLGLEGFNETLDVLHRSNLAFIGASNHKFTQGHVIIEKKDIRLGFLGYCEGGFEDSRRGCSVNRISEADIVQDITSLKPYCDVVIVSLHWGVENVFYPSPKQIELARKLIDSGASIILGHHPHVVQGIERYKEGLIAYSLGNFQFDFDHIGEISGKANESFILSVNITKKALEGYDIVPVKINHDYVPEVVDKEEIDQFVGFISEISKPIIEGRVTERWWFEEIASAHFVGNMKSWVVRIKRYGLRHALQCMKWLVSPFVIRCYIGMIKRALRKKS